MKIDGTWKEKKLSLWNHSIVICCFWHFDTALTKQRPGNNIYGWVNINNQYLRKSLFTVGSIFEINIYNQYFQMNHSRKFSIECKNSKKITKCKNSPLGSYFCSHTFLTINKIVQNIPPLPLSFLCVSLVNMWIYDIRLYSTQLQTNQKDIFVENMYLQRFLFHYTHIFHICD